MIGQFRNLLDCNHLYFLFSDIPLAFFKKEKINFSDEEILLLLRSFQSDPYSWDDIIAVMQENCHHLPPRAHELYCSASVQQIFKTCSQVSEIATF